MYVLLIGIRISSVYLVPSQQNLEQFFVPIWSATAKPACGGIYVRTVTPFFSRKILVFFCRWQRPNGLHK